MFILAKLKKKTKKTHFSKGVFSINFNKNNNADVKKTKQDKNKNKNKQNKNKTTTEKKKNILVRGSKTFYNWEHHNANLCLLAWSVTDKLGN